MAEQAAFRPWRVARRGRRGAPLGKAVERWDLGRVVDRQGEQQGIHGCRRQFRQQIIEQIANIPSVGDAWSAGQFGPAKQCLQVADLTYRRIVGEPIRQKREIGDTGRKVGIARRRTPAFGDEESRLLQAVQHQQRQGEAVAKVHGQWVLNTACPNSSFEHCACMRFGDVRKAFLPQQGGIVVPIGQDVRMVGAEHHLLDRYPALEERPRFGKVALGSRKKLRSMRRRRTATSPFHAQRVGNAGGELSRSGEVVEAPRRIGMLGAERLLADRQRALARAAAPPQGRPGG